MAVQRAAVRNVLVYDGVCNICNAGTRFVGRLDAGKRVHFVSMQSKEALPFLQAAGVSPEEVHKRFAFFEQRPSPAGRGASPCRSSVLSDHVDVPEPWVFSMGGLAALRVGVAVQAQPISAAAAAALALLPQRLVDALYDAVADNRYKWFGRTEACQIPTPAMRSRHLDMRG